MGITKEYKTLEAAEQIIDPAVPSLAEGEILANTFPARIATPHETTRVRRSFQLIYQNKIDYIPSMSGKKYETVNTQVECEDIFHPDYHMIFCQELIEEVPDATAVIMAQLSLNTGMKSWKGKWQAEAQSETKQLHFRDTFKQNHYRDLNEHQEKSILDYHMFLEESRDGTTKFISVAGAKKQRNFISKEYSSSPTVATESVILSCIIDAEKERNVAAIDISNAFIRTQVEN